MTAPGADEQISVLHLGEGVGPWFGGPGSDLPNYCRALADLGAKVTFAVGWSSEKDMPEKVFSSTRYRASSGGEYSLMGFRCYFAHRWRFAPGLARWLARSISKFDIVHLHSLYSFPVLMGRRFAVSAGKPYIISPHAVLAPIQRSVSPKKKAIYNALFARETMNNAAAAIFSAETEREDARPLGYFSPSVVIPYGIDLTPFETLPRFGTFRRRHLAGYEGPVVLYLGRLNAKKGLDLLIPAFTRVAREHPGVRLVLAGWGDPPSYADFLAGEIAKAGLSDRVAQVGFLSNEDKVAAFVDSDLFVLPSWSENFGAAMFEAMACGKPVVISKGVNLYNEVEECGAGIAAELDSDSMASALSKVLGSEDLRHEMGQNGRRLAVKYSSNETAAYFLDLYGHILGGESAATWSRGR